VRTEAGAREALLFIDWSPEARAGAWNWRS